MSRFSSLILSLLFLACTNPQQKVPPGLDGSVWVTTADKKHLLEEQTERLSFQDGKVEMLGIDIDPVQRFQVMDGFGFSLTGGSAQVIHQLPEPQQSDLLKELFLASDKNIGISYLRISVGASDLDDYAFTYDDLPSGKTDAALSKFTLTSSENHLIPVLKKILAINPDIKIMASPWSAPAWMKTNHSLKGGSLAPEYYSVYARYLSMYLKAMKKQGIPIDALTLQNEPENPKNNPSMVMTSDEEAVFVKDHLGPVFKTDSIATKIVVFDHNCDHPGYPIRIMDDPAAKKFIDGSAFHLYDGHIDSLSIVHQAHPDRSLYFTEQWTSGKGKFGDDLMWHVKNLIIGAPRNWSVNVLEWNLAADPSFGPHTNSGGCTECLGALTIGRHVTRNVSYYVVAQASKFIRPGSVRVASSVSAVLPNVAFITPDDKRILIVENPGEQKIEFAIRCGGKSAVTSLEGKAVGTFIW